MFWCSLLPWKVSGRIISSRNYVAKDISFGVGARAAMLQGVSEVAEAVKVTMGPKVVYIISFFFSEGSYHQCSANIFIGLGKECDN